jgi:hypothetical protein
MSLFTPIYMSDPMYDTLVTELRQRYPNACVLYIDRLHPESWLYTRYNERKGTQSETIFFHGTKHAFVNGIAQEGFRYDKNVTSVYGKGTYFSPTALVSVGYTNQDSNELSYMFRNRVVSSAAKKGTPEIYVVEDDAACLPEYMICFNINQQQTYTYVPSSSSGVWRWTRNHFV